RWSNVMMREELGFSEESFDVPMRSAVAVGLSYLSGAFVPVWPYIFIEPETGLIVSAISTVAVLFGVGALKTIITSRSWWRSGLESMMTGIAAAAVTYGAGRLFASR
ncbi:MAG TPA: VIT1/CCC1 transporter family protein, partial [Candidatus Acidoferrales bacterium]|nr:VIT1/CCC1 transporter family protein [Candidatus Acidoferrales bacterium]